MLSATQVASNGTEMTADGGPQRLVVRIIKSNSSLNGGSIIAWRATRPPKCLPGPSEAYSERHHTEAACNDAELRDNASTQ